MDTKAVAQEVRLTHWAEIMRQRRESGKTIRSWCRENRVCEKTYYYWQRRLRETACEQLVTPGFAEVMVREASAPLALPEAVAPSELHIEVAGVCIRADSEYPSEKLVALLRELTRSC